MVILLVSVLLKQPSTPPTQKTIEVIMTDLMMFDILISNCDVFTKIDFIS